MKTALHARLEDRGLRLRIGAASLIVASLLSFFVRPHAGAGQDMADGLTGLFYGLAIAFMLASLRSRGTTLPPKAS